MLRWVQARWAAASEAVAEFMVGFVVGFAILLIIPGLVRAITPALAILMVRSA